MYDAGLTLNSVMMPGGIGLSTHKSAWKLKSVKRGRMGVPNLGFNKIIGAYS